MGLGLVACSNPGEESDAERKARKARERATEETRPHRTSYEQRVKPMPPDKAQDDAGCSAECE